MNIFNVTNYTFEARLITVCRIMWESGCILLYLGLKLE